MPNRNHVPASFKIVFACFFLSGFAGLLYQTAWMRLALAQFGVNTSVVATVLTVFMLGLGAGTLLAGRWTDAVEKRLGFNGLHLYAIAECLIAIGGWAVPSLFEKSRRILLTLGEGDSLRYTIAGAALLSASLFPFCLAMGATFPTAMSFLKKSQSVSGRRYTFSYLYLANVSGAILGVLLPTLIFIEMFGFRRTQDLAVAVNGCIVLLALWAGRGSSTAHETQDVPAEDAAPPEEAEGGAGMLKGALFLTGFGSMAMEVLWTRIYTPFVGTFVYSFAGILAIYLVSTALGSLVYRRKIAQGSMIRPWSTWHWLSLFSTFSLLSSAHYLNMPGILRLIAGVGPFSCVLGFLTPLLVDLYAGKDPQKMAHAYSLNLLGCVLGPLAAGFVLIPVFGTRVASFLLISPFFLYALLPAIRRTRGAHDQVVLLILAVFLCAVGIPFESRFPKQNVRHDHTATVVVSDEGPRGLRLFVNGISITSLTPITKMMVHFPMAHLDPQSRPDARGLVICLGMGTSFRSLMSWGIPATVVELVPSVPKFFEFFFPDAPAMMAEQADRARIVIDDGRRFLDRTPEKFDLITIDPPPPPEAAGSSLLYSVEFYRSARDRLKPGGILQTWIPYGDSATLAAVTRSILDSFEYTRVYRSVERWGYHFIASPSPIPSLTPAELLGRMPDTAVVDMTEWVRVPPIQYFERMLGFEVDPAILLSLDHVPALALTDDRPVNEFFFLRRYLLTRR